ncbi:MAG: hypothetical protein LH614_20615 [Pyrinomonadaceae bacterium]|nr:hypothetical protein [Pyrinomonadaceae bacterium]
MRVFAEAKNKSYYQVIKARLVFNRAAANRIEGLTLNKNRSQTAKKIK